MSEFVKSRHPQTFYHKVFSIFRTVCPRQAVGERWCSTSSETLVLKRNIWEIPTICLSQVAESHNRSGWNLHFCWNCGLRILSTVCYSGYVLLMNWPLTLSMYISACDDYSVNSHRPHLCQVLGCAPWGRHCCSPSWCLWCWYWPSSIHGPPGATPQWMYGSDQGL